MYLLVNIILNHCTAFISKSSYIDYVNQPISYGSYPELLDLKTVYWYKYNIYI